MAFEFDYKQPNDMNPFKVITEGEGFFKIVQVEEKTSKAGNPMLVLTHKLQNEKGESTLFMQYVLQNEYTAENLYRICEAANAIDLYTSGNGKIDPGKLLGLKGRCKIKNESDEKYGDKSKIGRFIAYKPMKEDASEKPGFEDSDLPF